MQRNEAMGLVGKIMAEMLDATDAQMVPLMAAYNQVLLGWVPGTQAVFLVDEKRSVDEVHTGRVTVALIIPACYWPRFQCSEPLHYASVAVVLEEGRFLTVEKNRFGAGGTVRSLDQVQWMPGAHYTFRTSL